MEKLSELFDQLIYNKIREYNNRMKGNIDKATTFDLKVTNITTKILQQLNSPELLASILTLVENDLEVGHAYYTKTDGEPTLEKFMINEARLRKANESRGRMKNAIDRLFKNYIEND